MLVGFFGVFFLGDGIKNLRSIQKNLFFCFTQDIGTFVNIRTDIVKRERRTKKKIFYQRLIKEYTLNQWQFHYLEWTIEKIKKLEPIVDQTSFILRENPPHDYLVHLADCFNLFNYQ